MYPELGDLLYINGQLLFEIFIQLINTAIIIFVLAKFVYVPVMVFMNKRAERIENEISEAEKNLIDANNKRSLYEEKMNTVEDERREILEHAHKRGLEREEQIIREAKDEARIVKNRMMMELDREKEKAKEEMKNQIIDISALMASRIIEEEVRTDKQEELLDEAIKELGDTEWLG